MESNIQLELQRRQLWIDSYNNPDKASFLSREDYANMVLRNFDKAFQVPKIDKIWDNICPLCNTPMTQQTYGKFQCNNPACGDASLL